MLVYVESLMGFGALETLTGIGLATSAGLNA